MSSDTDTGTRMGQAVKSVGLGMARRSGQILLGTFFALFSTALLIPLFGLNAAVACAGVLTYVLLLLFEASNRSYLVWHHERSSRSNLPTIAGGGLSIPVSYRTAAIGLAGLVAFALLLLDLVVVVRAFGIGQPEGSQQVTAAPPEQRAGSALNSYLVAKQLGSSYDDPKSLCRVAMTPSVFYPTVQSSIVTLKGTVCVGGPVRIFGVVISEASKLNDTNAAWSKALFFDSYEGPVVKRILLQQPVVTHLYANDVIAIWDTKDQNGLSVQDGYYIAKVVTDPSVFSGWTGFGYSYVVVPVGAVAHGLP